VHSSLGGTGLLYQPVLAASHRPELEYLEAVNRTGPPRDPQLLFLLIGEYANANRHRAGAEFSGPVAGEASFDTTIACRRAAGAARRSA
jgi:hypothetical protein